ncbi:MAG: mercury(II) reductase [Gemmatimonadota bacterium]|nr:mercury(II) reductase [Gemmatimonadota bacterium]
MSKRRELTIEVGGMTCDHCERSVAKALESVPGITEVRQVSHSEGLARVVAGPETTPARIEAAVAKAGYRARVKKQPELKSPALLSKDGADFDLVLVGGGSAAFAAAIKGSELGARVAMVEGGTLGGTCVNVGCVPSKALIRAAEARHRRTHHGFAGISTGDGAADWNLVRGQKDALVSELRQGKYWDVLRSYPGISLFEQRAMLMGPRAVRLADGRTLSAGRIIVATGAEAETPPIPGLAHMGHLDNVSAMAIERLPQSLVVIGSGFIAVELGQMFSRLGVAVTLLARQDRVLSREEPEIGAALTDYLRAEGIDVRTETIVGRVNRPGRYRVQVSRKGQVEVLEAEQLLVATGRRARTAGIGLDTTGVALGHRGEILVDDHSETSVPGVYAAGDVTGEPMFVYVAAYGGALAAENALTGNTRRLDLTAVPSVTFSDPAVATVGLTETQARARGIEPLVSLLRMKHVPRSLAARDTRGFVKLVADPATRKILGAQILASEAGEMIMEPALAIRFGLTIEDLTSTFHPYLTLSEGIKLAALAFTKDVERLSCCAG